MKLFVSPHNDDETLFGAFTIQRERPHVAIVFDSYIQVDRGYPQCNAEARRKETIRALACLGAGPVHFLGLKDSEQYMVEDVREALSGLSPSMVWFPYWEEHGHPQHNIVSSAAAAAFDGARQFRYLTYTRFGKTVNGSPVATNGAMLHKKMKALLCYRTQIETDGAGCWQHFMRDQSEYVV